WPENGRAARSRPSRGTRTRCASPRRSCSRGRGASSRSPPRWSLPGTGLPITSSACTRRRQPDRRSETDAGMHRSLRVAAPLALSALIAPAVAQAARLDGRLADQASKLPITGARLSLTDLADTTRVRNAVSDERGAFAFEGIDPRTYRLEALRVGYAS